MKISSNAAQRGFPEPPAQLRCVGYANNDCRSIPNKILAFTGTFSIPGTIRTREA